MRGEKSLFQDTTACCGSKEKVFQDGPELKTLDGTDEEVKSLVMQKYAAVARDSGASSCCGDSCTEDISMVGDAYDGVEGYVEAADLSLGCGIPTEVAGIQAGDTVLDLGSGAGLDAFVARSLVGAEGYVLGVDMTSAMVEKARENAKNIGFQNVRFLLGDIESIPVDDNKVDVVISNCVLNLVPDKLKAFSEMYRVIRPGGHFCISDIVVRGFLPDGIKRSAELYAGCVAGAIAQEKYIRLLKAAGFSNLRVEKEKEIHIPDEVLLVAAGAEALENLRRSNGAIVSITVYGEKAQQFTG